MRVAVAARQLHEAEPVAMRVEAHRLGIDRDRVAEQKTLGQVAAMQLIIHLAFRHRTSAETPRLISSGLSTPAGGASIRRDRSAIVQRRQ